MSQVFLDFTNFESYTKASAPRGAPEDSAESDISLSGTSVGTNVRTEVGGVISDDVLGTSSTRVTIGNALDEDLGLECTTLSTLKSRPASS